MANPFNSEVGQQNKTGGKGVVSKRTGPSNPSLPFKAGPTGQAPGNVKSATGSKGYPVVKIYASSKGVLG